jgi:GPH family glycoside/pentoside/hexuronide:cation symporter
MRDYDVTEEKSREISQELENRKGLIDDNSSTNMNGKLSSIISNKTELNTPNTFLHLNTEREIEEAFQLTFNKGLHGLCFSPYTECQNIGDILTEEQIKKRFEIISPHTQWIRSFSCTEGNEIIPQIAHKKHKKTIVGAWISRDKDRNEKEIESLIKLANEGYVSIAAVGNEVLHRNEISELELIHYLEKVKKQIPSNIPVTYVDAYYQFIERPNLVTVCDVLLCNLYPFWEGANIDTTLTYLNKMLDTTQSFAQNKKIIISETGWPSNGNAVENAIPSKLNAMKYFVISQEWAKLNNLELFHFSSFDETWKVKQEGEVGANWGLWDKNGNFKFS